MTVVRDRCLNRSRRRENRSSTAKGKAAFWYRRRRAVVTRTPNTLLFSNLSRNPLETRRERIRRMRNRENRYTPRPYACT